jgi:hypothetical protein
VVDVVAKGVFETGKAIGASVADIHSWVDIVTLTGKE